MLIRTNKAQTHDICERVDSCSLVLQGYNNVIVYNRAFYFCLSSFLIIILDTCATRYKDVRFSLYGIDIVNATLLRYATDLMKGAYGCVLVTCLLSLPGVQAGSWV